MTNHRLSAMDARIHRVAARAGLADTCTLVPKSGPSIPGVRCFVRRGVQFIVDEATVASNATTLDVLRPDAPDGITKGWGVLLTDGEFLIDSPPQAADESMFRFLLRRK
jgi:hypothetical protein